MNYICPVCAFTEMPYAPVPYNICPCCGTEFGVDDRFQSIPELRQAWIKADMPWFDDIISHDIDWSPSLQLIRGGYLSDLVAPVGFVTKTETRTVQVVNRPYVSPRSDLSSVTLMGAAA